MNLREMMPFRGSYQGNDHPMTAMRHEFDRWFDEMTRNLGGMPEVWGPGNASPSVDLKETDEALEITAELPGVAKSDIDVQVVGDVLTIRAEKKSERKQNDNLHMMECSWGSYMRRLPLPCKVDESHAEAALKDGLLRIRLPKAPEVQASTKKIEIKSGS